MNPPTPDQPKPAELQLPSIEPWVGPFVRRLLAERGPGEQSGPGPASSLLQPLRLHLPGSARDLPPAPSGPAVDRAQLAESVSRFNEVAGHPNAAMLAERLADPDTEVIVTGQQAGLFGGPIYALSKAIAAELWARSLRAAGRNAISVFWIASEDHDFDEVRSARFGDQTVAVEDDEPGTRPVGDRPLDARLIGQIRAAMRDCATSNSAPPFLDEALDLAEGSYREGEPFSLGFARLLPRLLGDLCPLLLDSQEPVMKRQQVAWLERLLDPARLGDCVESLLRQEMAIEALGVTLQLGSMRVDEERVALPLFLHRNGCRHRVLVECRDVDRYQLRGDENHGSLRELLESVRSDPTAMSPSAALRPVLQDAVLRPTLQVLGPGELAYIPQAAPLYEALEVEAPHVSLRPQAIALSKRHVDHLAALHERHDLSPATVLGAPEELERVLAQQADSGVLEALDGLRSDALDKLEILGREARRLDPGLLRSVEKTGQHIERGLGNLRTRLSKACAQQDQVTRGRIDRIRELAVPAGMLQERGLCSLWLRAQFGPQACARFAEQMDLDPRALQILAL